MVTGKICPIFFSKIAPPKPAVGRGGGLQAAVPGGRTRQAVEPVCASIVEARDDTKSWFFTFYFGPKPSN